MHAHAHAHGRLGRDRRALGAALALVLGFAAVEAVAGLAAGSLALLADAAHMLSDAGSLGLALGAAWLAARPATPAHSFGFRRAEILAALVNGTLLLVLAAWIAVEAVRRLGDPPAVEAGVVLAVGALGLAVNVGAYRVLHRAGAESLNVRAAARHVVADLLGSAGVIVSALVVLATGWAAADPLVSLAIAVLVVWSAVGVLREAASILLEAAPAGIDVEVVGRAMASQAGVVDVHDLHVWTITSGFPSLSAHVVVQPAVDCHAVRLELEQLLRERFGLDHTTLQVEHAQGLLRIAR